MSFMGSQPKHKKSSSQPGHRKSSARPSIALGFSLLCCLLITAPVVTSAGPSSALKTAGMSSAAQEIGSASNLDSAALNGNRDQALINAYRAKAAKAPVTSKKPAVKVKKASAPVVKKVVTPVYNQVRVTTLASFGNMQSQIDRCRGAVGINLPGHPYLIAQHDYCGGTYQLSRYKVGDRVNIVGIGGHLGRYKVVSKKYVPKRTFLSALDNLGSVVLQTCTSSGYLLTGLVPVDK